MFIAIIHFEVELHENLIQEDYMFFFVLFIRSFFNSFVCLFINSLFLGDIVIYTLVNL